MSRAYYNENDKKAAAWLRALIANNLIAPGDVDERSITDVQPDDLDGYTQCHFFAGIGGWSIATRLAGWPDDKPIWSASCPCQPFSLAGKGGGINDERHLWPDFFRLVRARWPAVIVGEQVAAAVGKDWFLGVRSDLESIGYVGRGVVVPACAVNAPHRRDRLWFVAGDSLLGDLHDARSQGHAGHESDRCGRTDKDGPVAPPSSGNVECEFCGYEYPERLGRYGCPNCHGEGLEDNADLFLEHPEGFGWGQGRPSNGIRSGRPTSTLAGVSDCAGADAWGSAKWVVGHDQKARRIEPGVSLLVDGVLGRASLIRGYGNAIVPQLAAEVIGAWMDCEACA